MASKRAHSRLCISLQHMYTSVFDTILTSFLFCRYHTDDNYPLYVMVCNYMSITWGLLKSFVWCIGGVMQNWKYHVILNLIKRMAWFITYFLHHEFHAITSWWLIYICHYINYRSTYTHITWHITWYIT